MIKNEIILRDKSGRKIARNETNLYAASRSFKEIRFWEKRLTRQNKPYTLVEGEATIDGAFVNGYFIFVTMEG